MVQAVRCASRLISIIILSCWLVLLTLLLLQVRFAPPFSEGCFTDNDMCLSTYQLNATRLPCRRSDWVTRFFSNWQGRVLDEGVHRPKNGGCLSHLACGVDQQQVVYTDSLVEAVVISPAQTSCETNWQRVHAVWVFSATACHDGRISAV